MGKTELINGYMTACDEELLPASFRELVRSKTHKFNQAYSDLTNAIACNTTEEFDSVVENMSTDPDLGVPLNQTVVTNDGEKFESNQCFVKFGDILNNLRHDLDNNSDYDELDINIPAAAITTDGEVLNRVSTTIEIDNVLQSFSDGIQELNAQEAVMAALEEVDPDTNAITSSDYAAKVSMMGADWSTKALAVCQQNLGILTTKGTSVREKIKNVLQNFGLGNINEEEIELIDFNNESQPMTGASPAALWGDSFLTDIQSIPINNYIDAMTYGYKVLAKGIGKLFGFAGKWIKKTCTKIANSTYKSDDFQVIDEKCKNTLVSNVGFKFYVTHAASIDPAFKITEDKYTVFPFGFSRMYLRRITSEDKLECFIKWSAGRYVDRDEQGRVGYFALAASSKTGVTSRWSYPYLWDLDEGNNRSPWYEQNAYFALFQNDLQDPTSDKEAMNAICLQKRASLYAMIHFMHHVLPNCEYFKGRRGDDKLDARPYGYALQRLYSEWDTLSVDANAYHTYDVINDYLSGFNFATYDFAYWWDTPSSDRREPTNADFQNELSHFGRLSSGITIDPVTRTSNYGYGGHVYFDTAASSSANMPGYSGDFTTIYGSGMQNIQYDTLLWLVHAICSFLNQNPNETNNLEFYPYVTSCNGMEGRYSIKNDVQVADAYAGFLKTAAIVAAVVVISIIAIKVRIKAKRKYQDLCDEIQSKQYHRSEILGGAEPLPEGMTMEQFKESSRKELKKLNRKARRAAKLGGIKIGSEAVQNTIESLKHEKAEEIAAGISSEDIFEILCGKRVI